MRFFDLAILLPPAALVGRLYSMSAVITDSGREFMRADPIRFGDHFLDMRDISKQPLQLVTLKNEDLITGYICSVEHGGSLRRTAWEFAWYAETVLGFRPRVLPDRLRTMHIVEA